MTITPSRYLRPAMVAVAAVSIMLGSAWAQDRPPADAQPLSSIVLALEQQGFGPFIEIEFDDGVWEIEVFRDGRKRKLDVDPRSGKILRDRADG